MRTYKKPRTFHFLGAYIGECCLQPHLVNGYVYARSLKEAFEKIKTKWNSKGFDVGDVEYLPGRKMGYR